MERECKHRIPRTIEAYCEPPGMSLNFRKEYVTTPMRSARDPEGVAEFVRILTMFRAIAVQGDPQYEAFTCSVELAACPSLC